MHVDSVASLPVICFTNMFRNEMQKNLLDQQRLYIFSYFAGSTSKHDGLPSFADRSRRPDG